MIPKRTKTPRRADSVTDRRRNPLRETTIEPPMLAVATHGEQPAVIYISFVFDQVIRFCNGRCACPCTVPVFACEEFARPAIKLSIKEAPDNSRTALLRQLRWNILSILRSVNSLDGLGESAVTCQNRVEGHLLSRRTFWGFDCPMHKCPHASCIAHAGASPAQTVPVAAG